MKPCQYRYDGDLIASVAGRLSLILTWAFYPVGFRHQWHFNYGRTYAMGLADGTRSAQVKATRPITPRKIRPMIVKLAIERIAEIIRTSYQKENDAPIHEPTFACALLLRLFNGIRPNEERTVYTTYADLGI